MDAAEDKENISAGSPDGDQEPVDDKMDTAIQEKEGKVIIVK